MRIAAALSLAVLCLLPAQPWAQPAISPPVPVRVLINDAPPYRIVGSTNGMPGYSGIYVEILRLVAAEAGLQLEFSELPLARAHRVMEAGGADLMLGPNRLAEREIYLRYLEPPLPREPKVFLQHRVASQIRAYDDLSGLRIAVLRGASYFDRFDADAALGKVELDDYTAALRLVLVGRADTVVIPELQALWLMRETGFDLRIAPYRIEGRESFIVLARKSPLLPQAARIEAILQKVMAGNAVRGILQRYE